ncbi:MAG: hypothetical protein FWH18_01645 [Marinilabiliaceae bacterium]|nr:hypothetical protein [Marinilabiliaceae bacterium]
MEIRDEAYYNQILEMIYQLPEQDFVKLCEQKKSKNEYLEKNNKPKRNEYSLQQLILQAPTWTDVEYEIIWIKDFT